MNLLLALAQHRYLLMMHVKLEVDAVVQCLMGVHRTIEADH